MCHVDNIAKLPFHSPGNCLGVDMVLRQSLQRKIPLERQQQPGRTAPLYRGINIFF